MSGERAAQSPTTRRSTRKKLSEFWTSGNDVEEEGAWEWAGTGGTSGGPTHAEQFDMPIFPSWRVRVE